MTDRELLEQALKLVAKYHNRETVLVDWEKSVIEGIKARLAEDDDEPVAWMYPSTLESFGFNETFDKAYSIKVGKPGETTVPLFRRPQPKARLTDDEISQVGKDSKSVEGNHTLPFTFARAIEQKIWEKNREL